MERPVVGTQAVVEAKWEMVEPEKTCNQDFALKPSREALEASAEEMQLIYQMSQRFPEAPYAELLRFCRARKGKLEDASKLYESHLRWRSGPGSAENLCRAAQAITPKYVRRVGKAIDGSALFLVQGARYEEGDPDSYMLACAQQIEEALPRDSCARATVLVDLRPHEGWPNLPATKMMPFFKRLCEILPDNYPERLVRVVIYPMPWFVRALWSMVAGFLDPTTRDKFIVLGGEAKRGSPCPMELNEYVTLDQLPIDAHAMHAGLKSSDATREAA
eukprot:SRR837773.9715.p1 GENE.SRR837773.9715~~SRR837773.9715.p1  ORF type:complete len:275 (-),score=45.81 SRR837773.9715:62-886(-)